MWSRTQLPPVRCNAPDSWAGSLPAQPAASADILHRAPLPQSAVMLNVYAPDISNVYDRKLAEAGGRVCRALDFRSCPDSA
jgi:hypothetical protein